MRIRRLHLVPLVLTLTPFFATASACALRSRMCMTASDCGSSNICVAGRCIVKDSDAGPHLHQAIDDPGVVRIALQPIEIGYLRSSDSPGTGVPTIFRLGQNQDARLLLRFDALVPPKVIVLEAYLLLPLSQEVDSDPVPIALHASRIVDRWDASTLAWATQPRMEDTRSPATFVTSAHRGFIRIDVTELVSHWSEHDPRDQGLAIVADTTSATGIAISIAAPAETFAPVTPLLEIYTKLPVSASSLHLPFASASSSHSASASASSSAAPSSSTIHAK